MFWLDSCVAKDIKESYEEFYGIIARYTWGVPFTKKEVKNTTKKIQRKGKGKEVPQGFSMVKGKFMVEFD